MEIPVTVVLPDTSHIDMSKWVSRLVLHLPEQLDHGSHYVCFVREAYVGQVSGVCREGPELGQVGPRGDLDMLYHESTTVPEHGRLASAQGFSSRVDQELIFVVDNGVYGFATGVEDTYLLRFHYVLVP